MKMGYEILYYIFLILHYVLFLYAMFLTMKIISLSWKSYSLHDKLIESERKAKEEIQRIYWHPTWLIAGSILAFFIATIFNNI